LGHVRFLGHVLQHLHEVVKTLTDMPLLVTEGLKGMLGLLGPLAPFIKALAPLPRRFLAT
jgi:hypothetical protein